VILFLSADFLIPLWVGDKVSINKELYLVMAIYIIINSMNGIYSSFLNGVGKVMLQLYLSVGLAIIYVPLAIFFCNKFGIKGILLPVILIGFITVTILNRQYSKICKGTAKAIWSK
jgi:O-antigen/teichoic acid export membrane protein